MNTAAHRLAVMILITLVTGFGCKQRTARKSVIEQADLTPAFEVSPNQVASLPKSILGPATPIGQVPGLVIGVTPTSSNVVNTAATKALQERVEKLFLQQLSQGAPLFFATVAVNPQDFGFLKKKFVEPGIRSVATASTASIYSEMSKQPPLVRFANSGIAEKHLQAIHDVKREFHKLFRLQIPEELGETAPVSVAVVARDGGVYGPFSVSTASGYQLDQVFDILQTLFASEPVH